MTEKSTIICEAVYSEDKSHRFSWKRVWDSKKPVLCVVTLNPNSDNVFELDLTSMLVTNNTYRLGSYGGVTVVNLFSCITDRLRKDDFDEENSIAEEKSRKRQKKRNLLLLHGENQRTATSLSKTRYLLLWASLSSSRTNFATLLTVTAKQVYILLLRQ